MQTVADSSSAQNMSHLGLTMSSPCVGGGGGEPPIVLRVVVWWCAGWCGGHPCLLRTTATSHPFTRAQVSTTPWPGGSGHTLAIMLIVIHKYKCVPLYSLHRSAQDVVTSSSVCCGELRPAWPRGHCHHIFEHFNHSYPVTTTTTTTTTSL